MPRPTDKKWVVEPLGKRHDCSEFDCGKEPLDTWLRKFARNNQATGISKVFVAVRPGSVVVDGYYAVSSGAVAFAHLPDELTKGLPRHPIPVAHIGRLAVTNAAKGYGLGEMLLLDAFERIVMASESVGIHAVEVWAKDEQARGFYRKYGFIQLKDDSLHLYVPMRMLRKLLG